jgi:hypothetical protein
MDFKRVSGGEEVGEGEVSQGGSGGGYVEFVGVSAVTLFMPIPVMRAIATKTPSK